MEKKILFTHKEVGISLNQYGSFEALVDNQLLVHETLAGLKDKIDKEFESVVQATKVKTNLVVVAIFRTAYNQQEVLTANVSGLHRVHSTLLTGQKNDIDHALPLSRENAELLRYFIKVEKLYKLLQEAVKARSIKPPGFYGKIPSERYSEKITQLEARYKTVKQLPAVDLVSISPDV